MSGLCIMGWIEDGYRPQSLGSVGQVGAIVMSKYVVAEMGETEKVKKFVTMKRELETG